MVVDRRRRVRGRMQERLERLRREGDMEASASRFVLGESLDARRELQRVVDESRRFSAEAWARLRSR